MEKKQNFLNNTKLVEEYSYTRNQPRNKKFLELNQVENYHERIPNYSKGSASYSETTIPSYKNCPPIKKEGDFWDGVL